MGHSNSILTLYATLSGVTEALSCNQCISKLSEGKKQASVSRDESQLDESCKVILTKALANIQLYLPQKQQQQYESTLPMVINKK